MVDFFTERTSEIVNSIAADRLLVYHVSEGWEPLCKFLDTPVPDMEFPRINSRNETKELLSQLFSANDGKLSEEALSAAGHELHEK